MFKRFILAILALVLVFGGVIGFKLYKQAAIRDYLDNRGTPAVHVNGVVAEAETWQQHLAAIGSLRAQHGVDIRSEVDGVIGRVHVDSGQSVKTGDLLVELDDSVDRAVLKSTRIRLETVQRHFERDRSLFERKLISEETFDNSHSEYKSADALVEETQAIIDKKAIRAPFAGTLGIHNLVEGHYLEPGDEVVTLQALDTLYLDLHLPEKELERLRSGQRVTFTVASHGNRKFSAEVRFVDVLVQTATRNVLVRAEVDNASHDLLPGMFANVTVILDEAREVVTVPREAVAFSLYGETVFLLEKEEKVEPDKINWIARHQAVNTGKVRDGRIAVEGLSAGQVIALDTHHRLLEGSPVVIENLVALEVSGVTAESD